ncbi:MULTISPECIES: hypothetical protein [unclassified Microcella]|uniref:hypothetical protein n=1 Tax=unclassified Microcella TaxID=2630066 RepID=UPI0006FFDE2C|nr:MULTISPECIES: hypothetical protein [unclassified Microcella]KQV25921.1 hypothetical protein ASC54_02855 [Yonghaparkia sp. Root332]KRF33271.1 hypothetical protein ASG83_04780 [Yonghaparkia sp. Soil809]
MKTSLLLSIAGVLLAAGGAYAVNTAVLSSPSIETIGNTETAAVIVPHQKTVPGTPSPGIPSSGATATDAGPGVFADDDYDEADDALESGDRADEDEAGDDDELGDDD